MLDRIDHIGIVVHELDASLQTYCEQMGFALLERVTIEEQLVEAAFLDAGNGTIELIAPTDTESGTARFLPSLPVWPSLICGASIRHSIDAY